MAEPSRLFADRFELLRLIGRGSIGLVHAAHDHRLDRVVALKLVALAPGRPEVERELARKRFAVEMQAAQRLAHPDIVATLDAGHEGDTGWMAMEAVPGTSLTRYAANARLLPEGLVRSVTERVAAALAHAHASGVLHRDVKPSNILVDWSTDVVKLADFGVAHVVGGESTRTGVLLGTPAYLAPEVLAGQRASERSDLYALGVTMYQLLTGELPHEGASLGEWLRRITHEPAPPLSRARPDLPPPWGALIARLLARDPAERPSDAASLVADLQALRDLDEGPQRAPA
ncbi:MAG: serine/threonine protein kinase [Acidobacteria bacterium]|nr:serine/threonine protein kinase [Acidobacteriota bacterium]